MIYASSVCLSRCQRRSCDVGCTEARQTGGRFAQVFGIANWEVLGARPPAVKSLGRSLAVRLFWGAPSRLRRTLLLGRAPPIIPPLALPRLASRADLLLRDADQVHCPAALRSAPPSQRSGAARGHRLFGPA